MRETFRHAGLALAAHRAGERRAVVLQHGLGAGAGQPAQVFPAGPGLSLVTLECRGHGGSEADSSEGLSIATFADDLAAFVEARLDPPVAIGGISMGAAIALRLAVRRPDLVAALVLIRPAWVLEAAPLNMAPIALVGDLLLAHDPATARRLFDETDVARHLAEAAPDNLASLRGFFEREPVAVTAALSPRIARDGPGVTQAEVAAIAVPALVIGTARDEVHPLAHARALAAMIPGARLAEAAPKADDPEAHRCDVREAIATFLQETRA